MAEDANANIRIDIDTTAATAALKALQGQIARFHTEMARGGAVAGQNAAKLQQDLLNSINAGGQFQAGMTKVQSTTEAFTTALEKNKLSMGQYFRYAAASTKTFGRFFRGEFETITKVATERVKDLQTQYISMGRDANGALKAIKVRPLTLDMNDLATKTMIAAQKQQLYNQLLKQGSTNLLNFGKNTQWAGRQLMVGFTLPLTLFASTAAKSFMEIEKQVIRIRRVYGDFSTTVAETDQMIDSIKTLAGEYTKYGVAVSDTLGLAAEAAAAGKAGQELLAQVSEATRLAVLGNVEQTQALETTMSITNAFGTATEDLAKKINFLNAVENQSVTSIEDLTIAIPKAGPVVQQLGGDVEDLAFFLTAMKEGGINASEGANALKSGLAALINPTGKAKEMLNGFGINIEKIVNSNKGDIQGLVIDFASALDTLDPLSRARAIEQLFGKFQFSRLSTLFQNVIGEGTQASRVLELTKATTQELAILSQRELKKVEETTTYKFEKAFADFQAALAPVGEEFLKAITPVIEFGTKLLNQFNNMGDGAKSFAVILTSVVAGIGPVLLMTVGLVANGVANLIKMFQLLGNIFNKSGADTTTLGLQTEYMTQQQIEAAAVAASLNQSHSRLAQTFSVEAASLNALTLAYQKAVTAQRGFAMPGGRVSEAAVKPKKYADGVVSVPGPKGKGDVVPAMLSPGEAVIPAGMAKKYGGLINGMIAGNIPGYEGGLGTGFQMPATLYADQSAKRNIQKIIDSLQSVEGSTEVLDKVFKTFGEDTKVTLKTFGARLQYASEQSETFPTIKPNQLNSILDPTGKTARFRYSAGGGKLETQVGNSGDLRLQEEYRVAQLARDASVAARKEAGLPMAQSQQIDRAHTESLPAGGKATKSGWLSSLWTPQPSDINQLSNDLEDTTRRNKKFYEEYVGHLGNTVTDEKVKTGMLRKINSGLALSAKEIVIQGQILDKMLIDSTSIVNSPNSQNLRGRVVGSSAAAGAYANLDPNFGTRTSAEVSEALNGVTRELTGDFVEGVEDSTRQASPSKEAYDSGANVGQGAINGIDSKIDDAAKSGEKLGQATVNGTQATTRTPGKRGPRRVQTGVKDMGGFPVKTTAEGSQVIIGDTGRFIQEEEKPGKKPRTPREQEARDKMIRRRARNVKLHAMGGSIAAGVKGMGGMGAGMGVAMAGGALAMIPGLEGLGTAAGLAGSAMMMIPGPIGIVVAALIGLVGVIMSLNAAQEEQKRKAIELAEAQVMSIDALKTMSEDFGTVSATEAAQRKEDAKAGGITQKELTAGEQYLTEMASGQKILQDVQTQQAAGITASEIGQNVAANMATAVAQGVITTEQADGIIVALGRLAGDRAITAGASQQFATYTEDPTQISGMVAQDRLTQLQAQFSAASKTTTTVSGRGAIRTMADSNAALGAVAGTMSAYGQATGGIDAINAQYDALVKEAKTRKEINELERRRTEDLTIQRDLSAATYAELEKQKSTIGAVKFNEAFLKSFDKDSEAYKTAEKINGLKDSKFKTQLQADFAGGNISQATVEAIVGAADKNKALTAYYTLQANVSISKQDEATLDRLEEQYGIDSDTGDGKDSKGKGKGGKNDGGDSGSGGGGSSEEESPLEKKIKKRSKALQIIGLKEAAINKKYDERKKALEKIAKINAQIAAQQKDQLDIADALSRGDIAAAARAAQQFRANQTQRAQEAQAKALEDAQKKELEGVTFGRKTRSRLESILAKLELRLAKQEYRKLAGGGMAKNYSVGGKVMSYFADGGSPLGSDTVPAMLTPGEFVVKRPAVQNFGVKKLEAINSGKSSDSSVYTYNVSVNVATNSDPDAIARTVVTKIRSIDKQRLGGNSY